MINLLYLLFVLLLSSPRAAHSIDEVPCNVDHECRRHNEPLPDRDRDTDDYVPKSPFNPLAADEYVPKSSLPPSIAPTFSNYLSQAPSLGGFSGCKFDTNNLFGSSTGTPTEFQYQYEVETIPGVGVRTVNEIIRTLIEPVLNEAMLPVLFSRCTQTTRKLTVSSGASGSPPDEILIEEICGRGMEGNDCFVIQGLATIYTTDGLDPTLDIEEARNAVRESINDGTFDNLDNRLARVTFIEGRAGDQINGIIGKGITNRRSRLPVYGGVLIGISVVAAIVCICCCFYRKRSTSINDLLHRSEYGKRPIYEDDSFDEEYDVIPSPYDLGHDIEQSSGAHAPAVGTGRSASVRSQDRIGIQQSDYGSSSESSYARNDGVSSYHRQSSGAHARVVGTGRGASVRSQDRIGIQQSDYGSSSESSYARNDGVSSYHRQSSGAHARVVGTGRGASVAHSQDRIDDRQSDYGSSQSSYARNDAVSSYTHNAHGSGNISIFDHWTVRA